MSARGPRLGNLEGLKRKDDEDDPQAKQRRPPANKGGIKILPLIPMFVMFGPIILSGLIFVCDYVVNSEWGIKIGLADDPRTRLTKFYKKHNPTKMRDVDKLLRKYKGNYAEMFKRLDAKYNRQKSKESEEEEEFLREQARYEQEAREAQEKF